ncbi:MAG: hypothetical protein L6R40_006183 [Gallowayella cf. fulva]|nr:MAG: hypothetical protein L6R40_006183 [Xanthomendoza cf. fulva]
MPNIPVNTRSRKPLAKLLKGPTQFGFADAARGLGQVESDHPGMDFEPGSPGSEDKAWYRSNKGEEDQASVAQSTLEHVNYISSIWRKRPNYRSVVHVPGAD